MTIRKEYRDTGPIYSRAEAETRNAQAGLYFFDPTTLHFLSSRISESFYPCEERKCSYFVTSERDKWSKKPRAFTVRTISWGSGRVRTIGEFLQWSTSRAAHVAAKHYAANGAELKTTEEG